MHSQYQAVYKTVNETIIQQPTYVGTRGIAYFEAQLSRLTGQQTYLLQSNLAFFDLYVNFPVRQGRAYWVEILLGRASLLSVPTGHVVQMVATGSGPNVDGTYTSMSEYVTLREVPPAFGLWPGYDSQMIRLAGPCRAVGDYTATLYVNAYAVCSDPAAGPFSVQVDLGDPADAGNPWSYVCVTDIGPAEDWPHMQVIHPLP